MLAEFIRLPSRGNRTISSLKVLPDCKNVDGLFPKLEVGKERVEVQEGNKGTESSFDRILSVIERHGELFLFLKKKVRCKLGNSKMTEHVYHISESVSVDMGTDCRRPAFS